jgi:DNA damage-binding protein 1
MRVVSTFHPPSSVTDAIKCRLTSDHALIHLVVTKSDRLDIYSVQPSGLRYECGAEIWGRVVTVRAIPAQVLNALTYLLLRVADTYGWDSMERATCYC